MYNFFDDAFENEFLGFGRPRLEFYSSGKTQDLSPAYWTKDKDDESSECEVYRATVRSVGVNPKDVKIKCNDDFINVSGETKYGKDIEYNFSCDLPIAKELMNRIYKIECHSENGLSHITLRMKKVEPKKTFDIDIV